MRKIQRHGSVIPSRTIAPRSQDRRQRRRGTRSLNPPRQRGGSSFILGTDRIERATKRSERESPRLEFGRSVTRDDPGCRNLVPSPLVGRWRNVLVRQEEKEHRRQHGGSRGPRNAAGEVRKVYLYFAEITSRISPRDVTRRGHDRTSAVCPALERRAERIQARRISAMRDA